MDYISVKDASVKFGISERRVQKLCEENRISGAQMISNVWIIPATAKKPNDDRISISTNNSDFLSLGNLCNYLSISTATGRNWIKLNKISPTGYYKGHPFFSLDYCEKLKATINSNNNTALKSRRNKKYIFGSCLYQDYISENSKNLQVVQNILNDIDFEKLDINDLYLRALTAECSLQLLQQRYEYPAKESSFLLRSYLNGEFKIGVYHKLVDDLIAKCDLNLLKKITELHFFGYHYIYEPNEDIIGLLYISCKNIAARKATGAYYTPTKIVKTLIKSLNNGNPLKKTCRILDPCCGTGNFLLQLPCESVENIFGIDIDEISVQISRINMALKFNNCNIDTLYANFQVMNYFYFCDSAYDFIIGNPPWGFDYNEKEKESLRGAYTSVAGKTVESYDLFVEQSLHKLRTNGVMSFVLPEAILNVKIHQPVRELILHNNSIEYINYLGNVFDKVQCPCIILQIKHTMSNFDTAGMNVVTKDYAFQINTSRKTSADYFSFTMQDSEYKVLDKIQNATNCTYLKDNAIFALGLVTGNNKQYIINEKKEGYETVLKGSDIYKYHISASNNYLYFDPKKFQQTAPAEYYRAPEKLLYRFISNQLVFAYDNNQTLSLNSCNIIIPKAKGMNIKYIMSILNSRIAQFVFSKLFQSVKVLKSHIGQLPIPVINVALQDQLVKLVDQISNEIDKEKILDLYNLLDAKIANIFSLNEEEYSIILKSVENNNLFLY